MTSFKVVAVAVIMVLAVLYKPFIQPVVQDKGKAARDLKVGTIGVMSGQELTNFYGYNSLITLVTLTLITLIIDGKRRLVVGGTRGVGFGTALAVVRAGGHVTIVGRTVGNSLAQLEKEATGKQPPRYLQGDLSTVASTQRTLTSLAALVAEEGLFDYLVCSVAVFPQWNEYYSPHHH
jgi:hypothetical protein